MRWRHAKKLARSESPVGRCLAACRRVAGRHHRKLFRRGIHPATAWLVEVGKDHAAWLSEPAVNPYGYGDASPEQIIADFQRLFDGADLTGWYEGGQP